MAELRRAWGYQGDAMNLPVADVEAAIPYYETVMEFRVVSRGDSPYRSVLLQRDSVQIGLAENAGDPSQDGCAFEVDDVAALFEEFKANGLGRDDPQFTIET